MKENIAPNNNQRRPTSSLKAYQTYVVTDNITLSDGSVKNRSSANAVYGRNFVNENKK